MAVLPAGEEDGLTQLTSFHPPSPRLCLELAFSQPLTGQQFYNIGSPTVVPVLAFHWRLLCDRRRESISRTCNSRAKRGNSLQRMDCFSFSNLSVRQCGGGGEPKGSVKTRDCY